MVVNVLGYKMKGGVRVKSRSRAMWQEDNGRLAIAEG
jgi:hypothetical protein